MNDFEYYLNLGSEKNLINQIIDEIDSLPLNFESLSKNTPAFFIKDWQSKLNEIKTDIEKRKFDQAIDKLEKAKKDFNDNWILPHTALQNIINLKIIKINHVIDQITALKHNRFRLTTQQDQIF